MCRKRARSACTLGAIALAVGATVSACAGGSSSPLGSASPIEREFAIAAITWDLNKDGNVTCDEWKQYVTALFRDADANRDGILTREEYAKLVRSDRLFETVGMSYFDANADGRLSLTEMTEKANPAFALLDKNGDCVISKDELLQPRIAREEPKSSLQSQLPPMRK